MLGEGCVTWCRVPHPNVRSWSKHTLPCLQPLWPTLDNPGDSSLAPSGAHRLSIHVATLLCWRLPRKKTLLRGGGGGGGAAYRFIPPLLFLATCFTPPCGKKAFWLLKGPCLVSRGPSESLEAGEGDTVIETIQAKEELGDIYVDRVHIVMVLTKMCVLKPQRL